MFKGDMADFRIYKSDLLPSEVESIYYNCFDNIFAQWNFDNNNSGNFSISNSNIYGALLNYGSNFEIINNTSIVGSVVSNYLVTINDGSSITKGNLPSFYGTNFGLSSSVIPGSYLEY